ncbi:S26 family signal peptidase [Catellatospora methionotrophica]|uniref:S26 family signal peptidase n=1 Tax=Catellatospora methionotrophica TaxID=121620 RepID=A0A8J3LEH0_9ACTN|nr:S26 family signal peptidase [Catellatospora methionotrophica]GIG17174.1 S26 family signal peptidase [Catellatospora methionotrophica]
MWVLIGAMVLVAVMVLILANRFLVAAAVTGRSMLPAYREGDLVLVVRRFGTAHLRIGQVVVVRRPRVNTAPPARDTVGDADPRRLMLKRVLALPGDPVPRASVPALADRPETVVPPGMMVLVGDNATASYDSRQIGYFPASWLIGVAVRKLRSAQGPLLTPTART